jgi:hypothetical protein
MRCHRRTSMVTFSALELLWLRMLFTTVHRRCKHVLLLPESLGYAQDTLVYDACRTEQFECSCLIHTSAFAARAMTADGAFKQSGTLQSC